MKYLKEILVYLKKKNKHKEKMPELFDIKHPQSKMRMPWNIYTPGSTKFEFVHNYHMIHYVLKTKIMVPILLLIEKFFGKHLIDPKDLPKTEYNKVLRIMYEEREEAIIDWNVMMLGRKSIDNRKKPREYFIKNVWDNWSCRMQRTITRLLLTMDNTDNVYRELDVIWFFRMFQRGLREFCKYDVYNHLMYSGNASLDRN